MVMAPTPTRDSAVLPCFQGGPAFLHRHFPPWSPPSHPFHPSLCSQQQPLPWDCSTVPKLQLPAAAPSSGPASLSRVCMVAVRHVWFSFHLGCHRSAVSLSALNVSALTQTLALMWGIRPLLQFPHPRRAGPVLPTLLFPPVVPSLLSFARFYIFFSPGQVLLSTVSWRSACTSVSEGVFLMYQWREMYSMSTYSSAILFSLKFIFNWRDIALQCWKEIFNRNMLCCKETSVVLVSVVWQRESTIRIHVFPPSWTSLTFSHPTSLGYQALH